MGIAGVLSNPDNLVYLLPLGFLAALPRILARIPAIIRARTQRKVMNRVVAQIDWKCPHAAEWLNSIVIALGFDGGVAQEPEEAGKTDAPDRSTNAEVAGNSILQSLRNLFGR